MEIENCNPLVQKPFRKQIKREKEQNIRVIPLGGLGEVGRNMMLLEYENSILIIDMGFRMPGEDMPGIDYIIPNISYLKGKNKNILGVVFTHGHYDHIGAVPYLMERIGNPPIFASALTQGIILKRQEDFPYQPKLEAIGVQNGSKIQLGPFKIEFFRQNHNIPDNLGLFIQTPIGNIIDTSDFKFDNSPVNDLPTDFEKLRSFSRRGVLLLMSDSTGAENEGHSLSERTIIENLDEIFKNTKGRIIAATFASLINRIQQIITLSEKYGRKVVVEGFSMKTNVEISKILGFIKSRKDTLIRAKEAGRYHDSRVTILCTGAQGEGQAVLMRIANKEHSFFELKKGDTVIFSSSVIPGNERTVQVLKDEFYRQGCIVYHYKMMDIHAGGHAQQEELKEMIKILRPRFFLPIHGQYSMLVNHGNLAKSAGIPEKNIVIAENGQVINLNRNKISIEKKRIEANYIMVDGLGVGDVGEVVLRDRHSLAKDGMFVIIVVIDKLTGKVKGSPDIISRGFVYLRESKELLRETRKKTIDLINRAAGSGGAVNWTYVKDEMRNKIGQFLFSKTQRRPMILPVVIEV
ncbi:MAG: ribonuclease J [Candidatus Nealsonbacteria bacterium CG_4_10_14_0_2_um_filter_38_17]|uniref:Ribonuclease J n=2 Tax=Candidatus Nealsoniibacteriota TaxID=1817911 RepID=A0A2M7UYZ4_9BACT|nr:MAG: ribonuclease J [Candidatus Nealsonbacteria bacterium CG23_combo_of_CG06-09_8_20_14_all_38_19]PIZ89189.1 MAG: ribonuclease J [Candidatus Nealsonbacteria bacterium CG_4_10_14_0_2_um_filter_38_17]